MSGVAGYTASVKIAGTPTNASGEQLSTLGSSVEFQVNDSAKRLLDFGTSLTFQENSCSTSPDTISSTNISSINRLFGIVTFNNQPSSAVEIKTGKYLPVANVAGANSVSVTLNKSLLDDTDFNSSGYVSRVPGLGDASVTLSRWDAVSTEFYDSIANGNDLIMEIRPSSSTNSVIRGIFVAESESRSADPASLVGTDITLQLNSTSTSPPIDIRSL